MLSFGLNQVTMARAPLEAFAGCAARLGMVGVELRNDLGRPVFDGMAPGEVARMLRDHGLRLLGLSQVYPFNRFSADVADEVRALIDLAAEAGAESVSLIPCNDGTRLDSAARREDLARALEGCLPMLDAAGMVGLVEPLGFARSSLREKAELVAAIEDLGAAGRLRVVHDTFHHALAGGGPLFAGHTGIVHISGVTAPDLAFEQMEDAHRVLVDAEDRLDNIDQIRALLAADYGGVFSFECFAPEIHTHPAAEEALSASMTFISSHVSDMAA